MTNPTETQAEGELTDAWRQALTTRRTQLAEGTNVPAAIASRPETEVSRRNFLRAAFWGGLGAGAAWQRRDSSSTSSTREVLRASVAPYPPGT